VGLSDDQRALLRLLAQREQGYDDIAALMGLSVAEVRVRVKDALDAVEREGGEAPAVPAPPVRTSREPAKPAPEAEAPRPEAKVPEAKPKAEPPRKAIDPAPAHPSATKKRGGSRLPKERRVMAIAGGLGVIVVVMVLLATGAIGGGSGSDSGSDSGGAVAQRQPGDQQVTGAVLEPLDGGDAKGRAVLGKEGKVAAMIVEATGLEPSGKGSSYAIWLYKSAQKRIPLIFAKVGEDGRLVAQFKVPTEVLAYLAAGTFDQVYVSLGANKEFAASLAAAKKAGSSPTYAGTDVLAGEVTGPLTEIDLKQGG
jgi:hypothetical protein